MFSPTLGSFLKCIYLSLFYWVLICWLLKGPLLKFLECFFFLCISLLWHRPLSFHCLGLSESRVVFIFFLVPLPCVSAWFSQNENANIHDWISTNITKDKRNPDDLPGHSITNRITLGNQTKRFPMRISYQGWRNAS